MNENYPRHVLARVNMHGNQVLDFAVENVVELPGGYEGRLVCDGSGLHLFHDGKWLRVSDEIVLLDYQTRAEKDQPGGYAGLDGSGKIVIGFLPTGNVTGTVPLLDGEVKDGQSIIYSADRRAFIPYEVSSLYKFLGSVESEEDLALIIAEGPKNGDTYNLLYEKAWHGHTYARDTSWAWEGNEFQPLAGALVLTEYQRIDNMVQEVTEPSVTMYPSVSAMIAYVESQKLQVINSWPSATRENVPSGALTRDALDLKTDVTMAIAPWNASYTYRQGSTVISIADNTLYLSTANSNTGHPVTDADWWMPIQGGGGGGLGGSVKAVTRVIGDGVSTEYTIAHWLGTPNVHVTARTLDTESKIVTPDVTISSDNEIVLTFFEPIAENSISVTIMGVTAASAGDAMTWTQSTPSAEWVVEHGFNTPVFVQVYDDSGDQMYADIVQQDSNTTVISFGVEKAGYAIIASAGEVSEQIVLSGAGRKRVVSLGEAKQIRLESASGTWTVHHDKKRLVLVQMYDDSGDQMYADIQQDVTTLDTVTIHFSKAVTGIAVIL